jgi:hypothetical protein
MNPRQPSSLHIFASAFGTDILYSSLPTLCIWNRIFRRSSGDTTVRETAPATPPATKDATTGCANVCRMRSKAVRSGARGYVDQLSWTLATAVKSTRHTLASWPAWEFMVAILCDYGCAGDSAVGQTFQGVRRSNVTCDKPHAACASTRLSEGAGDMGAQWRDHGRVFVCKRWTEMAGSVKVVVVVVVGQFGVGAGMQGAWMR